jgi:hypothetical protein
MEPEGLLAFSQNPTLGSCPEPDGSSLHPHTLYFKIHFNIVFPCLSGRLTKMFTISCGISPG